MGNKAPHRPSRSDCGCHPLISPCEEITLVHAVKRPLRRPLVTDVRIERSPGDSGARLGVDVLVDRKSTGRVALQAGWTEWIDDPAKPIFRSIKAQALVHDEPITSPFDANDFDAQGMTKETLGHEPEQVSIDGSEEADPKVTQQFGDNKHRVVDYSLVASSRFKNDFEKKNPEDPREFSIESEPGRPFTVSVPSTARPKKPNVAYVIPTFGWTYERESFPIDPGARVHSTRQGGGLRVYLERGWFSSGEGELLGVVFWPGLSETQCARLNEGHTTSFDVRDEFPPVTGELAKYVTRWGLDPRLRPHSIPFLPTPHHFSAPNGVAKYGCDLVLEECEKLGICNTPEGRVSVAGFKPEYDAQRGLWRCDIRVNPVPAYNPFIRLAVVRYQPDSLRNCEVSAVEIADFAQLLPDRSVSITRVPEEKRSIVIQVSGRLTSRRSKSVQTSLK